MNESAGAESDVEESSVVPAWLQLMIGLVALSALIMLVKYLVTFGVSTSGSQEVWGQFGDFFGGILNPLLSSLTLAAVLVTMRLQSKELKVAQQENKRANEHLEKQANYIRTQNFESVFFRLLDVHASSRSSVCVGTNFGKDAFDILFRNSQRCVNVLHKSSELESADNESLEVFRLLFQKRVGDSLNVYCRSLYQVIKYVDTYEGFSTGPEIFNQVTPVGKTLEAKIKMRREQDKAYRPVYFAKRQYVNMLRAQLTQPELWLLYMSCLTDSGLGLKYFAEKYSLFKGLAREHIAQGGENPYYGYLAFADYEDIRIKDVRLLDALNERTAGNKRRQIYSKSNV
jgi:uncharacterized membrane protein